MYCLTVSSIFIGFLLSALIFSIYLHYVAPEDIHNYSIDEAFNDCTAYLPRYTAEAEQQSVSAAHVMAYAVTRLWPETKLDIGPSTDDGFYYDFDLPHRLGEEDFVAIEAEMAKIDECVDCGLCKTRCPYELDIPNLLRKNLADYNDILAGRVQV